MRRHVLFLSFCSLLGAASGAARAQPRSGVTGTVSQTPGCPGPQRIDQGLCVAPVGAVRVQLRKASGQVAASVTSAADGSFTLHAPAGRYHLHVDIDGAYPRCEDAAVTIRKGRLSQAELRCDSGMR